MAWKTNSKEITGIVSLLALFLFLIGSSAVIGGIVLVQSNGMGMPVAWIKGYFPSFVIPGMILAGIIGGTHILASIMLLKNYPYALEAAHIAAFGLLIWIFTQQYIIHQSSVLQIFYFSSAILTLIITAGLQRKSI